MEVSSAAERAYGELQNRFRGLVAGYRSKEFVKKRASAPSWVFRSGVRGLLLDARATLEVGQFAELLSWVDAQVAAQLPDLAQFPVGYDELSGVITRSALSLERELVWIAARINARAEEIRTFRLAARDIEELIFQGEYESAIFALQIVDLARGVTMWSVQLRICLEQLVGGLERQKRYTADVRGVYRRGLLGFMAYHTSVRNEERTTLPKFEEDIRARIEKHQYYDPPVQAYLKYRLIGEWSGTEAGIADVLRVEQSHSLIDIYETFVAAVQEIARRPDLGSIRAVAAECLRGLPDVGDFRLCKAAMLLDGQGICHSIPSRDAVVSDAFFMGDGFRALRLGRRARSAQPVDVWPLIYAGFALAASPNQIRRSEQPLGIERMLGALLKRCASSGDAYAQLAKLAINLRGVPTGAALVEFLRLVRRGAPDDPWRPWLVGLNAPTIGIEDLPTDATPSVVAQYGGARSETARVWGSLHSRPASGVPIGGALGLFSAARQLSERRFEDAIATLDAIASDTEQEPARGFAAALRLNGLFALGDRAGVIELLADEGARGEGSLALIPVQTTLSQYGWQDYSNLITPFAAPIALHLLWQATEDELAASHMRYKTGLVFRTGGTLPSTLIDHASSFSPHQLVYFLRNLCVPNILDVSRVIRGTEQLMLERVAVCRALQTLDPPNAESYDIEAVTIINKMALADGQYVVDRTRIHVDTDALARWALKELAEDFERYRDLRAVDLKPRQTFDDVLKELSGTAAHAPGQFVPENEADALLFSILRRLADEFLNNSLFGLDYYLSKRIRHQSFTGFIRGPLEFSHLITTKEKETSDYHPNTHWLARFSTLDDGKLAKLNQAFIRNATQFDDLLAEAKDRYFHVRSAAQPNGLISLGITSHIVALARAIIDLDFSFRDFIHTSSTLLWGTLEHSLALVRKFISEDLKTQIVEGFGQLRTEARAIALTDPAMLELDAEIGQRSAEVQRALDEATTWFTRADVEAQRRLYTLEQARSIAIDAALKCQRAFDPRIDGKALGTENVTATVLVVVHDVIFVALDNARMHSGLKAPKVTVDVIQDAATGEVRVEIVSEARQSMRAAKEAPLKKIRRLIDTGTLTDVTRREGRSGFVKLAAIVSETPGSRLDFGFTADNEFHLAVTYAVPEHERPQVWHA